MRELSEAVPSHRSIFSPWTYLTEFQRSLLASGVATLMSSALPVSITLIGSHTLKPDELGQVSLVLWCISIGALLGNSWSAWLLPQVAQRPSPASADGVMEGLGLSSAGGGVAAALTLVSGLRAELAVPSALGAAALGAIRVLAAVLQGRGTYLRLALSSAAGLIVALISLAIVLAVSVSGGALVASYVVGLVSAAVVAYAISGAVQARPLSATLRSTGLNKWTLILVLGVIDSFLWQRGELLFLHYFRSDQEVGQYGAAYAVVATIGLPAAATAAVFLPRLARAAGDSHDARVTYSRMWIAVSIAFPVLLWLATLSATLLVGRAGSELSPSPSVLAAILAIGMGPAACGVVSASAFYATGRIGRMVSLGGAGAITSLALDFLLIPGYGMLGAAAASASIRLSVTCLGFLIAGRMFHVRAKAVVLAGVALGAGALGDLGLLLIYAGAVETGLLTLAAATLIVLVVGIRFLHDVRHSQL